MREGWKVATIGDLAIINPEHTHAWPAARRLRYIDLSSVSARDGVRAEAVAEYAYGEAPGRARRVVRTGDVLVATVRPYLRGFGKVPPWLDQEVASTGFAVLRAREGVAMPGFLWCIVQTDRFVDGLMQRATGSSYPAVRPEDVATQPVNVPPLAEQRRIVDLISAVDRYRAAAQASADLFVRAGQRMVSAEWHAMGAERAPVTSVAGTAFGHRLHDGDWIESKDQSPSGEGAIRLLQLADLGVGEFLDRSDRWITPDTFRRLRCTAVLPGDLLISRMAEPAGRTARVPSFDYGMVTAVDCTILRLDPTVAVPDYWLALLNSQEWLSEVNSLATGSTRRRVTRRNLERIAVPVVPIERQRRVGALLASVADTAASARRLTRVLTDLRTSLLANLLSGDHELPASYDRFLDGAA